MFWRKHSFNETVVPNYLSGINIAPRQKTWETFGAFFAVQLLAHSVPPPRISRWVVLALLNPVFNPPFSLVRKYEPDIANRIAVWFERPAGPIISLHLGTSPNGQLTPIDWLVGEVFGNQTVRCQNIMASYRSS
jgi:hypothetical protein